MVAFPRRSRFGSLSVHTYSSYRHKNELPAQTTTSLFSFIHPSPRTGSICSRPRTLFHLATTALPHPMSVFPSFPHAWSVTGDWGPGRGCWSGGEGRGGRVRCVSGPGLAQMGFYTSLHPRPAISRLFFLFFPSFPLGRDDLPHHPLPGARASYRHHDELVGSPLSSVSSYLSARHGKHERHQSLGQTPNPFRSKEAHASAPAPAASSRQMVAEERGRPRPPTGTP